MRNRRKARCKLLASATSLAAFGLFLIVAGPGGAQTGPEPSWRGVVRDLARDHFSHPAWGYSHSVRDYDVAKALALSDLVTVDDDVLFAAAYLHDIAGFAPWAKTGVDHADQGADVVGPILLPAGFPAAKLAAVQAAIRTHMYQRDPAGPEARYLHDADAVDWLGAIGAARIIALVDPKGGHPTGPEALSLLKKNLAETPPRIVTPAGKALGHVRAEELAQFIKALESETEGLKTL
jgi:hypothetical protein